MESLRTVSATGAVGHEPFHEASFRDALERAPDYLGADAGSGDIGPVFLGADAEMNPIEWESHDLELLLVAARSRKIPLIIGSAGGAGTRRGVDQYVDLIKQLAARHKLGPFKLARVYSDVPLDYLRERAETEVIESLGAPYALTGDVLDRTSRVVAMMGIEPYIEALERGADVIIAGRSCDDAIYAAIPVRAGYPKALAYHMGKTLECASLVGDPSMSKESIVGTITHDHFDLEPMHPKQRCTPASVAGHSLYERSHPYLQGYPGGALDTSESKFVQLNERTTRVSGSRFVDDPTYKVKLEGSGFVGFRCFTLGALRDPLAIERLPDVIESVRADVRASYASLTEGSDYRLLFHQYGRDAVMQELEPRRHIAPHELCLVTEVVAQTRELASVLAQYTLYRLFFPTYKGQKGTAGGLALIADEVLEAKQPAYEWTVDHLLPLQDPMSLFPVHVEEVK